MTEILTHLIREPCLAPSPGIVSAAIVMTHNLWELEQWSTSLHLISQHFCYFSFLRSEKSAFTQYAKNVSKHDSLPFRTNRWALFGRLESGQNSPTRFLGGSNPGIFGYQARNAKRSINWWWIAEKCVLVSTWMHSYYRNLSSFYWIVQIDIIVTYYRLNWIKFNFPTAIYVCTISAKEKKNGITKDKSQM